VTQPRHGAGYRPQRDQRDQRGRPRKSVIPLSARWSGKRAQDLSLLMRQELELAKAEVKQEVSKTGKAAGMLGGACFACYMVLLFASIALWLGTGQPHGPGRAALVVTGIWAVIGAVLVRGRARPHEAVNPKPEQTVETVRELPDTLKPAARSRTDQ